MLALVHFPSPHELPFSVMVSDADALAVDAMSAQETGDRQTAARTLTVAAKMDWATWLRTTTHMNTKSVLLLCLSKVKANGQSRHVASSRGGMLSSNHCEQERTARVWWVWRLFL